MAGPLGHWEFEKGEALTGAFPTATLTRDGKYTSEFSQVPAPTDILLAWEAIQTWAPDYQSGFEEWIFTDDEEQARLEGARLEDGQLVITSTGSHVSASLETQASDMFAVQYDFFASDASSDGHCIFYTDAGPVPMIASLYNNGATELSLSVTEGVQEGLAGGIYNPTITNTVTRIVLGDQVAEFINDRFVLSASDPGMSASYNHTTFAVNFPITCAYDNYTYWDLSGLELSSKVDITVAWDAINHREPDYQSGFDEWVFEDDEEDARSRGARLEDGQLLITSTGDHVSVILDTPDSDMFAIQYDFLATDTSDSRGHCIFYNALGDSESNLATGFFFDRSMTLDFQWGGTGETLATGTYNPAISNTVTRIVLGDQVAEFLNGRLVYNVSDPRLDASYVRSIFAVNYPITCTYDNFAYWDLSGLGDPSAAATDEPASQPDWMTDFYNPRYEYTREITPDFDGGRINDYRDWLDTDCVYPDVDMSAVDSHLYLDCSWAAWKSGFRHYLIEMVVRLDPKAAFSDDGGFEFWVRGSIQVGFDYSGIEIQDNAGYNPSYSYPGAYLNPGQDNHIVIIVDWEELALVVNGQPVHYSTIEDGDYKHRTSVFSAGGVTFKSIYIWDLE